MVTRLPTTGSVRVGGYALEIETQADSFAQFEPEREHENAQALATALVEEPEEGLTPVEAVEALEDGADAVTDRIEHANRLFRATAEGRLLERDLLTGEVGALLGLLQRLDRAGRFDEELRLARAVHGLLVLAFRWLDLIRSLRMVLAGARKAGDEAGQAWALHELGTLHLCAGDAKRAAELLEKALALEQRVGDMVGRCATRHNLDSARRDLAQPVPAGSPERFRRIVLIVAALALFGGGAALGVVVDDPTSQTTDMATLAVEKSGDGDGIVAGADGAIDCGSDCSAQLEVGTAAMLTAQADDGSVFVRWEGADCDEEKSCALTLDDDVNLRAVFELAPSQQRTFSVEFRGDGSGSVSGDIDCDDDCTETLEAGSPVTLTAEADQGSVFVRWEDVECEQEEQEDESCTVTVNDDITLGVVFEPRVTLSVKKGGSGTVTSNPPGINCGESCEADFAKGTEVTLTAVPDDGSDFTGWSDPCSGTGDCTVALTENTGVAATFQEAEG